LEHSSISSNARSQAFTSHQLSVYIALEQNANIFL
jgi:hypothetical protein